MARGCFHVQEQMTSGLLAILLKKVAGMSDSVTQQLQSLSGFAVQYVYPPAPAGVQLKPMPADIHPSKFIAVFLTDIEHGTNNALVMCNHTVSELRKHLDHVDSKLRVYLQFHRQTL